MPDDHGVAVDRDARAEMVARISVGGLEVGLLAPRRAVAHEDVGRAGVLGAVVALVAVHPSGTAGLTPRPDHHRVARHRYRAGEAVHRVGGGGFEIGLLGDGVNGQRVARAAFVNGEAESFRSR